MTDITELCDCVGKHMEEVAGDIGVFASICTAAPDDAVRDRLQKTNPCLFDREERL